MADHAVEIVERLSSEARAFERDAEAHIAGLQREKLAAGRSYSGVDGSGCIVHVHPDGTVRASRDPRSKVIG